MKKVLPLLCILAFASQLLAQKTYVAKFKDGTEIAFEVQEDHTDQMHKLNIYLHSSMNDYGSALAYNLRASWFMPDKMFIQGGITANLEGGSTFGADLMFFLGSKEKEKEMSLTLKSEYVGRNTIQKKVAKFPGTRKTYFGLHGGIYQKGITPALYYTSIQRGTGTFDITGISVTEILLGAGLFRGQRSRWKLEGEGKQKYLMKQGTTHLQITADVQFLLGNVKIEETTMDTAGNLIASGSTLEKGEVLSSVAARLYLSGKASFVGPKDFGLTYGLGVGTNPMKMAGSITPYLALGIYMGFVK